MACLRATQGRAAGGAGRGAPGGGRPLDERAALPRATPHSWCRTPPSPHSQKDPGFTAFPTYPIVLGFKGTDQDVVSFPSPAMMEGYGRRPAPHPPSLPAKPAPGLTVELSLSLRDPWRTSACRAPCAVPCTRRDRCPPPARCRRPQFPPLPGTVVRGPSPCDVSGRSACHSLAPT